MEKYYNFQSHAVSLLDWYDCNARKLPWRAQPHSVISGEIPDPYHVWLSEIMLQQTTVKSVIPYFLKFISKWSNIFSLAEAKDEEIMEAWAGLGYYRRARNLIKCARFLVNNYNGIIPKTEKELLSLPGVGAYTCSAILSIAFNKKATVVDGNIERVISRLFVIREPLKASKKKIKSYAEELTPNDRFGDYCQAMMDLGATICTPKKPKCSSCPLKNNCMGYKKGIAELLPITLRRSEKRSRYGFAFLAITRDNDFLTIRRPNEGLLGGMICFPCSEWLETKAEEFYPPFSADWIITGALVTHTFTHFKLNLRVVKAYIENAPEGYQKNSLETFDTSSLPALMKKVLIRGISVT